MPKHNYESADWYSENLYYLGWSHLKLAKDPSMQSEEQKLHFFKAEKNLQQLSQITTTEKVYLALLQCYLAKGSILQDQTAYAKADELLVRDDLFQSNEAKKYKIQSLQRQGTTESLLLAIKLLDHFIVSTPLNEIPWNDENELYYLYGSIAGDLSKNKDMQQFSKIAEESLWKIVNTAPTSPYADESLNFLGNFYLQKKMWDKAEQTFLQLVTKSPQSLDASSALFWSAYSAEKLKKDPEEIKNYRRRLFENYPGSIYAPSAYFHYYSYREYLQGDRTAIKHLQAFKEKFPQNPLLINSHYLIGLDYKRDRKTIEGKSIRKKNLMDAIDNFLEAETLFDLFLKQKLITEKELPHYAMIKYRAVLERALANQAIGEDSQGAKKDIYLQYAEELFTQLNNELANENHLLAHYLPKNEPFSRIYEESLYAQLQSYIKSNKQNVAENLISDMLKKYQSFNITTGYYLSRIYYDQGILASRQENYDIAWECLTKAEESNQTKFLSVDQKLDLWIQQALCCKAMQQMDKAMLILSKVINDDAVSGLRLKAMFLRAEIYEQQGRHELARKQLEATAKKGGEWAQKAKIKLDQEYGYQ